MRCCSVAPLVGAWIEILMDILKVERVKVAPLVGAWIEIVIDDMMDSAFGRSPCGSVD